MKLYVENEEYNFSDDDLEYMYLDEGNEAKVYRYKNLALKVYKDHCRKIRLNEDITKKMCSIETKRILLPRKVIYGENSEFLGYVTDYITGYSLSHISKMKMRKFVTELDCIYDDVMLLSDKGFELYDLHRNNMLYDGGIYLSDPGSYILEEDGSIDCLEDNIYRINTLIVDDILKFSTKLTRKKSKSVSQFLSCDGYIGEFIKDTADPNETIHAYMKRISR